MRTRIPAHSSGFQDSQRLQCLFLLLMITQNLNFNKPEHQEMFRFVEVQISFPCLKPLSLRDQDDPKQ